MAELKSARSAQYPLVAEFQFNFDDTMVPAAGGAATDFGVANLAATVFEVIPLPKGAVVTGGELVTETAFDSATYTVSVGDSLSATRYLGATDVKSAGRVALVPTGFRGDGENIRITVDAADVCTAGKATLRVQYVISGKANEVVVA